MDVYLPPKVLEETVTTPKKEGFPNAFLIEENLEKGLFFMEGHTFSQIRHLVHFSKLISGKKVEFFSKVIALLGHTAKHAPQPAHFS